VSRRICSSCTVQLASMQCIKSWNSCHMWTGCFTSAKPQ